MTPDTRHADRSGEQGWALARLIGLHDGMRNDLALLRRAVAAATRDGAEADAAVAALDDLSFRQPGWSLRTYCAEFCGFVHEHHSVEDAMVFPALLQQQGVKDPELRKVIDKLSADHRVLTGYWTRWNALSAPCRGTRPPGSGPPPRWRGCPSTCRRTWTSRRTTSPRR
jgi:hypothetical protein